MKDEQKIMMLRSHLRKAAETLRRYERNHLAKEPPDTAKADANGDLAEEFELVLKETE